MKVEERTRGEVEAKLNFMSDFLKMEYLESCLKQHQDFDVKRLCNNKLAELYEGRNMFSEAAKNMSSVAEIAATFREKMNAYMKEVELWIKAARYDIADDAFRKALACGNTQEKEEMKKAVIELYKKQAAVYENTNRNSNALKIWQKVLEMVSEPEKIIIREKLLGLYKRLGKIREYSILSGQLKKQ